VRSCVAGAGTGAGARAATPSRYAASSRVSTSETALPAGVGPALSRSVASVVGAAPIGASCPRSAAGAATSSLGCAMLGDALARLRPRGVVPPVPLPQHRIARALRYSPQAEQKGVAETPQQRRTARVTGLRSSRSDYTTLRSHRPQLRHVEKQAAESTPAARRGAALTRIAEPTHRASPDCFSTCRSCGRWLRSVV